MSKHKWEKSFTATLVHRATKLGTMDKWHVSIDGFETTYSKGLGLREGFKLPMRPSVADVEDFFAVSEFAGGKFVPRGRRSRPVDPTALEVLEALACDASCYNDACDIDDFAANYGDGSGKISTVIESFEACRKAAHFFTSRGLDPNDFAERDTCDNCGADEHDGSCTHLAPGEAV